METKYGRGVLCSSFVDVEVLRGGVFCILDIQGA